MLDNKLATLANDNGYPPKTQRLQIIFNQTMRNPLQNKIWFWLIILKFPSNRVYFSEKRLIDFPFFPQPITMFLLTEFLIS